MRCPTCNQEFNGNFCPNCGAPAPQAAPAAPEIELCPGCGAPLENGVCPLCGEASGQQPAQPGGPQPQAASFRVRKWMPWVALPLAFMTFDWVAYAIDNTSLPDPVNNSLSFFCFFFNIAACTWLFRRARTPEKGDTRERWIILGVICLWMLGCVAAACIWGTSGEGIGVLLMMCTPLLYTLLRKKFDPSYGTDIPCFWRRWRQNRKEEERARQEAKRKRIAYNRAHGIRMCPNCHSEDIVCRGNSSHTEVIHIHSRQGGHSLGTISVQDPEKRWRCRACRYRWTE